MVWFKNLLNVAGWCSEIYVPTHIFVHKKKVPRNFEKFFIIRVTLCRVSAVCFSSCLSPTQIIVWRLTALQANAKLQQTCKCKIFRSKSAHIMLTLDELWKPFATDTSSFEMHKNKMRLIKTCTGWHPTKWTLCIISSRQFINSAVLAQYNHF